jgi:NitT/TauT family transport system permease protein
VFNFFYTFTELIIGFLLGSSLGIGLGILIALYPLVDRILYPYLVALQSMPKIAVSPLIILWIGFGMSSKIVISALVCFFPVLVNTVVGLRSVEQDKVELIRSYCGSKWQIFRLVRFPSSLSFIFAGLQVGIVLSLLGTIVGEFVGAKHGLGNLIIQLNFTMDVAGVFSLLIILSLLGVFLNLSMRFLQRKIIFWQEEEGPRMSA